MNIKQAPGYMRSSLYTNIFPNDVVCRDAPTFDDRQMGTTKMQVKSRFYVKHILLRLLNKPRKAYFRI